MSALSESVETFNIQTPRFPALRTPTLAQQPVRCPSPVSVLADSSEGIKGTEAAYTNRVRCRAPCITSAHHPSFAYSSKIGCTAVSRREEAGCGEGRLKLVGGGGGGLPSP